MARKTNPVPPARVFRHVIEELEADGYPKFMEYQSTVDDKIGELAATFGGIALYSNGVQLYVVTAAFPYPEPVNVVGKLTGTDYTKGETQHMGRSYIPRGSVWMTAEDGVRLLRHFADKLEARINAK